MFKIDFTTQCLVTAWLISAFSLYYGSINGSHWFARSGSLIVLFSVMAEYQLITEKQNYMYAFITKGQIQTEQSLRPNSIKDRITHASVIFGTLIWGYGDLL